MIVNWLSRFSPVWILWTIGLEVNGLGRIVRSLAEGLIVCVGIVAELAILHILANASMQCDIAVAGVAVVLAHHESPRDRCLVRDGKGLNHIESDVPHARVFTGCPGLQRDGTVPFHTHREAPLGIGRDGGGERVGHYTVGAGSLQ